MSDGARSVVPAEELIRCSWAGSDPLYRAYHDTEWGVPSRDERHLFEMLNLEGAQAGLSWITILKKRENYRRAFDGFDPEKVARYDDAKVALLLADAGIVRNRLKVAATIGNARAYLALRASGRTLADVIWAPFDGKPRQNRIPSMGKVPAKTAESDRLSKELAKLGFKFVGSTIVYAYLQAVGCVNDHLVTCFRHDEVASLSR
ncbi:MAG: DNA-3-methyladenine glycosylase I [Thermoanaerobaculia bacterium]|nr:DNA-3-methyladenine glycosylase I [Thermoanaerobaculia bacterium]